jgi:hypothetical protein
VRGTSEGIAGVKTELSPAAGAAEIVRERRGEMGFLSSITTSLVPLIPALLPPGEKAAFESVVVIKPARNQVILPRIR